MKVSEHIVQAFQWECLPQCDRFQVVDRDTFSSQYHQLCWMAAASRTMEGC